MATQALALEQSGLSYQSVPPTTADARAQPAQVRGVLRRVGELAARVAGTGAASSWVPQYSLGFTATVIRSSSGVGVGRAPERKPCRAGVALPAACGILPRTMSEESTTPDLAELTRLAFEAVNQRDIDAAMSFFAPDAVLDGRAAGGLYEGRVAIRGFLTTGSLPPLRMEVEELVVLDDGVVLAVVRTKRVRPVGVMVESISGRDGPYCWSADGLLVRLTTHTDIDEARAAAERLAESRG